MGATKGLNNLLFPESNTSIHVLRNKHQGLYWVTRLLIVESIKRILLFMSKKFPSRYVLAISI